MSYIPSTTPTITNKTSLTVVLQSNSSLVANSPGLNPINTMSNIVNLGVTKLSQLSDVNTSGEQDGDAVIFQANTDTYVVEPYNLDSGEF